jgi:uncharacterized protein YndB with AHSA1/START domain
MRIDRAEHWIPAPAERVYQALTTREAVEAWLPPAGARGHLEAFEPRPGGAFRMTLTFDTPGEAGAHKSSQTTDVVEGQFLELVPNASVRQRFTFVSDDPAFAGAMRMTWTLTPEAGGTRAVVTAKDVPPGIRPEDHEQGMASSLQNLAAYLEASA